MCLLKRISLSYITRFKKHLTCVSHITHFTKHVTYVSLSLSLSLSYNPLANTTAWIFSITQHSNTGTLVAVSDTRTSQVVWDYEGSSVTVQGAGFVSTQTSDYVLSFACDCNNSNNVASRTYTNDSITLISSTSLIVRNVTLTGCECVST